MLRPFNSYAFNHPIISAKNTKFLASPYDSANIYDNGAFTKALSIL
jgi:hypothetical protein